MADESNMDKQWEQSALFSGNASFIEDLYSQFLHDPNTVEPAWRDYFAQLRGGTAAKGNGEYDHHAIQQEFVSRARAARGVGAHEAGPGGQTVPLAKQVAVLQLINAFRFRGHQTADLDPLGLTARNTIPDLLLSFHGLSDGDLDTVFNTGSLVGPERATLRDILAHVTATYTHHIGAEYMHITSTSQKRWLQERLESTQARLNPTPEAKKQLLARLIAAEGLEKYLHAKYVGQKRFSLEGAESLIPLLDCMLQRAGDQQVKEVVIGMAHRGRLNVLINVLGKSPAVLFKEFEGHFDPTTNEGSGDVKYHQGFSCDLHTQGGDIHVALAFNPSHLEIISPVVEGSVRARQERRGDRAGKQVLPVLIHGDAAFAGQGVVMETFNMSQARGYTTGGSVHIIINNQIGFTTSNPVDARSTMYCTEVARMVQAPIFHVNGDDPEAVLLATQIAFDFRQQFRRDVVIDLVCYRRHGHSEADEPAATQPQMYQAIRKRAPVTQLYGQILEREGLIGPSDKTKMDTDYRAALDASVTVAPKVFVDSQKRIVDWAPYIKARLDYPVRTSVDEKVIRELSSRLLTLPNQFQLHPRVEKIMEERHAMAEGNAPLDWGFAETMAYAALMRDGFSVRISGQDSGRGTFFHRHAVLHNQAKDERYIPLETLAASQVHFTVIDSLLSEEAVLAFEYGFSSTDPKCLTIWEAQFGDFANNAQVVIDQFICSSESKWSRFSGLVMLLPHGFDGQGPEHSSARLERYLQLCAEDNIQVCVPTTPAQMFHMLRRQMLRPARKPLIVMTPKSLLRHRDSTSSLQELTAGEFHRVIAEPHGAAASRVVLCSGKVYFDLLNEMNKRQLKDVALVRVEQLYPFPREEVAAAINAHPKAKDVVWCQDEPENQGAWRFIEPLLRPLLHTKPKQTLSYAGRPASAAPAVGYLKKHTAQQQELIDAALTMHHS